MLVARALLMRRWLLLVRVQEERAQGLRVGAVAGAVMAGAMMMLMMMLTKVVTQSAVVLMVAILLLTLRPRAVLVGALGVTAWAVVLTWEATPGQ
jgi:hypothetical protein